MKILWVTNVILPRIEKMQGKENKSVFGGWLSGLSDNLLQTNNIELRICYPQYEKGEFSGSQDNFSYCGLPMDKKKYIKVFSENLMEYRPDVIHFFGTEFSWSYELLKVCADNDYLSKTVISIQGLVNVYAEHFFANMPSTRKYTATLSELYFKNSSQHGYRDYKKRGITEKKEILLAQNVIGRTTWDKACVKNINDNINYYFCNETLRSEFYSGQWNYETCNKFSIYFSQASKPIKGLHILLKALSIVVAKYPQVSVHVAGNNIIKSNWIKGSSYGMYIKHLIRKYKLENNIKFLGPLNASEVKNQLLKSNLFVSSSSIENSPNSLGEAMLLGVPCVASDVGGVIDMMTHNEEGYVYPYDEYNLLAYYIMKIFEDQEKAEDFSEKARQRAFITHNEGINNETLINIYKRISKDT